jgi:thiol-disulfide isomerase/thioredoxin
MLIQNITSYEDFEIYLEKYKYIIVNISATWCKPCIALKPYIEKFVTVIDEIEFIYLKLDNNIYDTDNRFEIFFNLKKIPYFCMIQNKKIIDSFISSDFSFVSKKIYDSVTFKKNDDF